MEARRRAVGDGGFSRNHSTSLTLHVLDNGGHVVVVAIVREIRHALLHDSCGLLTRARSLEAEKERKEHEALLGQTRSRFRRTSTRMCVHGRSFSLSPRLVNSKKLERCAHKPLAREPPARSVARSLARVRGEAEQ